MGKRWVFEGFEIKTPKTENFERQLCSGKSPSLKNGIVQDDQEDFPFHLHIAVPLDS